MSIGNVTSYLRILNGDKPEDCTFHNPTDASAFDAPWAKSPGVTNVNFDTVIEPNDISPLSPDEILATYTDEQDSTDSEAT